jgi:hypothetical protein
MKVDQHFNLPVDVLNYFVVFFSRLIILLCHIEIIKNKKLVVLKEEYCIYTIQESSSTVCTFMYWMLQMQYIVRNILYNYLKLGF